MAVVSSNPPKRVTSKRRVSSGGCSWFKKAFVIGTLVTGAIAGALQGISVLQPQRVEIEGARPAVLENPWAAPRDVFIKPIGMGITDSHLVVDENGRRISVFKENRENMHITVGGRRELSIKLTPIGDKIVQTLDDGFLQAPKVHQESALVIPRKSLSWKDRFFHIFSRNVFRPEKVTETIRGRSIEYIAHNETFVKLVDSNPAAAIEYLKTFSNWQHQRILLTNYLMQNTDCHFHNLLIKKGGDKSVIPIDFDLSLKFGLDLTTNSTDLNMVDVASSKIISLFPLASQYAMHLAERILKMKYPSAKIVKWVKSLDVKNQLKQFVAEGKLTKDVFLSIRVRERILKHFINSRRSFREFQVFFNPQLSLKKVQQMFLKARDLTREKINYEISLAKGSNIKVLPKNWSNLSFKKRRHYQKMYRQHRDRIDELFVDNIEVALRGVDLSKEMKIAEEMLNPTERQSVEQTPDNPGILARVWRPVKKLLFGPSLIEEPSLSQSQPSFFPLDT